MKRTARQSAFAVRASLLGAATAGAFLVASPALPQSPPAAPKPAATDSLAAQVRAVETAFAATMASRDPAAFVSFLDEETVFMGKEVMRGRAAVAEAWKPFFEGEKPPFSWAPEQVQVLDSGTLAYSTGPVLAPDGRRIGTFNSVWRLGPDGRWRIIFDKGCPRCECPEK